MKRISITGFLFLFFTINVSATSLEFAFLGYSNHHIDRNYDYNEHHKLIGLSINNGFSVAHFVNSYHQKSTLIGWKFRMDNSLTIHDLSFNLGGVAGIVTGYEQEQIITYLNDTISLYLIPEIIVSYPITDTITISLVNGVVPDSNGVIFMHHLELSFDQLF